MAGGRPRLLTPKVRDAICDAIRQGATYEIACRYAGVSYAAYRKWILRGEAERDRIAGGAIADGHERPFVQLINAVATAEADAAISCLLTIKQAATSDPRWAAWLLERRFPEGYSAQQRIDLSLNIRERAEQVAAVTGLSVDEVLAEAERMVSEA